MAEAALEQIDATLSCDLAGVTPIRRKLLSEKGTIIMRLALLATVAFLTASCSPRVYEPPRAVPTPPRSSEVQPEPLADNLANPMVSYVKSFPSFDSIHPFDREIINLTVGVDKLKKWSELI